MTTPNTSERPNRFRAAGDISVSGWYGHIMGVAALRHVNGQGHVECAELVWQYGFRQDVTRDDLIELVRRGQEALAAWPKGLPDVSGALARIEEPT